jgi:hypothetical protein
MKHTGITGLTNIEPEKTLDNMMITIGDSQSDVAYPDDGEDRYNEDGEQTKELYNVLPVTGI